MSKCSITELHLAPFCAAISPIDLVFLKDMFCYNSKLTNGFDGAVANESASGAVGTEFASRY